MNPIIDTTLFRAIKADILDWDSSDLAQQLAEASTTTPVDWSANNIDSAMIWIDTPQGGDYWAERHNKALGF